VLGGVESSIGAGLGRNSIRRLNPAQDDCIPFGLRCPCLLL